MTDEQHFEGMPRCPRRARAQEADDMRRLQERSGVPDALWRLAEVLADIAGNTPEGGETEHKRRASPVGGIRSGSQALESRPRVTVTKVTKVSS